MKRYATLLGVASCVVCVVIVVTAVSSARRASMKAQAAESAAENNVETVSEDITKLRQEVSHLRAQIDMAPRQVNVPDSDAPRPTSPDPSPLLSDLARRAEEQKQRHEFMAALEARFHAETHDREWSPTTTAALRTALVADATLRQAAQEVDCRSRTCRLELLDDGSGKLNHSVPKLGFAMGSVLPDMNADYIDHGDGTRTMVLYMYNRGQGASTSGHP
jgi:hypothetical protein